MKYQPSAVSVVCTVCSDQPATRYPSPIPVSASHRSREPAGDVDAEQLEHGDDERDPGQPRQHLDQPPPARRVPERQPPLA